MVVYDNIIDLAYAIQAIFEKSLSKKKYKAQFVSTNVHWIEYL